MSDFPLGSPEQKLNWELRQTGYDDGKTDDAGLEIDPALSFPWPEDPDERIWVPFYISLNEYTALLSAVDVGAAIAWTDDALLVYYILVRCFSGGSMQFCEKLIDCLTNDPDVIAAIATLIGTNDVIQEALRTFVTGDSAINEYFAINALENALAASQRAMNLLKPDECGFGFVFNEVSVFVELMNTVTIDMFEAIEIGSNIFEQSAIFAGLMGSGAGTQAAASILGITDQLISFGKEEYEGAYDTALYDDIRCGIFCLVKDDCDFFIDRAFDYYSIKLDQTLPTNPIETLGAVLQFLLAGDYPGDAAVYAMHLLVIAAIRAGRELLGIDFSILGLRILAAGDEEDNDWEVLCEDCAPPSRTPVINSLWDPSGEGGTISGPDVDGFWTATSTAAASDERVTMMDIDGRDFVITDLTFSVVPSCEVWLLDTIVINFTCDSINHYVGQTIDEWVSTWSAVGGHQTMRFKMTAP